MNVTRPLPNGKLETITVNDVLFGDVWICSGQSNMQFVVNHMFNVSIEIQNANKYPKVRLFTVAVAQADAPQEELTTTGLNWSVASNTTLSSSYVSAVCWVYGRMIHEDLGRRPIGLIHTSMGRTNIESWSPPEVLQECGVSE